jgi:ABC-type nitrate/sulfonate/bicarbonate transport system substrate-binding protein
VPSPGCHTDVVQALIDGVARAGNWLDAPAEAVRRHEKASQRRERAELE